MSQNICEYIREKAVSDLFKNKSFSQPWTSNWKTTINGLLTPKTASNLINIGDELTNIFKSTSSGRNQSSVSSGGYGWEALVAWYLNFCLIGTRTVVIKQTKDLIPTPIREAIQVSYGSFISNTEADLIAITFPEKPEYSSITESLSIRDDSGNIIPLLDHKNNFNFKPIIDLLTQRDFKDLEVGIIQCKTNWNDNAQIPMLWDIVYSTNSFTNKLINVGTSSFSIKHLKRFSYSFVTLPSNNSLYNPNSTPVKRVQNLSGGNYWGRKTQSGVASSLKEIFGKNFNNGHTVSLPQILKQELSQYSAHYNYFNL